MPVYNFIIIIIIRLPVNKNSFFLEPIYEKYKNFCKLNPLELRILRILSCSLMNLTVESYPTKLSTLCELLYQFPLLKSLDLDINSIIKTVLPPIMEDLPKLLHLKQLKIEMRGNNLNEIMTIFDTSSIQSLKVFNAEVEIEELNYCLLQHKDSLKSLTLKSCFPYNDNKFYNFQPNDFNCFDCLHQLRKLYFIDTNCSTIILMTECIKWITDLKVVYRKLPNYTVKEMDSSVAQYFTAKGINERELLQQQRSRRPLIIMTNCPFTGKIIRSFIYVYHDFYNDSPYANNTCESIPLTLREANWNKYSDQYWIFSVHIRDNENDFKNIDEVKRYIN